MNRIVQCVPNISEGRDKEKIEYIVEPLKNGRGFKCVSVEPDPDYHRTVITLIGNPNEMIEPLISFFERAKNTIDLNRHQGEHPRMGAVDVCPFIPIQGITMDECVDIANQFGKRVWEELHTPVFLYAKAAKEESRISLPNIRKGEFEGMKEKIKEEKWRPDFGNPEIHPTFGVVAIGARMPLVAYNIDLDTKDEKIARQIAKIIRGSSGGFQHIQAGPASLIDKGHVQVTMNILDYEKNAMYRIFELVKLEAKRYQVEVISSEVVGVLPRQALLDSIKYYLLSSGLPFDKNMGFDEIVSLSQTYLKLRDFNRFKIIEAN